MFVDEIDVTRGLPFSVDEFFAGVRQCYVGRATDPALSRLTVCLLGTATPADLIQDTRTSPFNIGRRIEVRDFTPDEAAPLAEGLGANGPVLLSRVLYWTGGHPYLTQRLCRAAQESDAKSLADVDKPCLDLFLTRTAAEADDNLAFRPQTGCSKAKSIWPGCWTCTDRCAGAGVCPTTRPTRSAPCSSSAAWPAPRAGR